MALELDSAPQGATVRAGDEVLGTTPLKLELDPGSTLPVRLELAGHVAAEHELSIAFAPRLIVELHPEKAPAPEKPSGKKRTRRAHRRRPAKEPVVESPTPAPKAEPKEDKSELRIKLM